MNNPMNFVALTGRVATEPKVHTFETNKKTTFRLVTDEGYYDKEKNWQDRAEFHNISAYRELNYQKGDLIILQGKLRTRTYEKDGVTRYLTEVIAGNVKRISRSKKAEGVYAHVENDTPEMPELPPGQEPDLPF